MWRNEGTVTRTVFATFAQVWSDWQMYKGKVVIKASSCDLVVIAEDS